MTITEKYIAKILPYLDEEVETEIINGLVAYKFCCPFCTMYVNTEHCRSRKVASLIPIKGSYDYKFICARSSSPECSRKGGGRSFHNFLAMYNPALFNQYKSDLMREKKL